MNRLTTAGIVSVLRDEGLTKPDAERMVSAVLDAMKSALVNNEEVHLTGIGKFVPTYRPAHLRKVFGKVRELSERRGVRFSFFGSLIKLMNANSENGTCD